MFNAAEVDDLFASTARALQRSRVLLDERRSSTSAATALPLSFCPPPSSTAAGAAVASSTGGSGNASSFTETVRSLHSLGEFRGFVEATTAMQAKVLRELRKPSAGLQARRGKGQDVALLMSLTRTLREATSAAWRMADATAALWGGGGAEGEGEEADGSADIPLTAAAAAAPASAGGATSRGGHTSSLTTAASSTSSSSSGAQLTATLLFSAFCVDVALTVPRAAPSIAADVRRIFSLAGTDVSSVRGGGVAVAEWAREGDTRLRDALHDAAAFLPRSVVGRLVGRAAALLLRPLPHASSPNSNGSGLPLLGCYQLSGGQYLFPALSRHLLTHYPSSLASTWLLQPLHHAAVNLRADYYRSAADFDLQCRWLLSLVFVLVYAMLAAPSTTAAPSALAREVQEQTRHIRTAQRVYEALLMPLEKTFGHDGARQGMSTLLHHALVAPHALMVQHLLTFCALPRTPDRRARTWSSLLHTAHYRLLLVLEKVAQSEVAQANGTSSVAAMQRSYEALLRQNGGKFTVALLQTLAEDRQLVLEETPSRAPDGQRLYRLHCGTGSGSGAAAVFVYVDDGAIFSRVGRGRVFQRVQSVEDVFRPLQ